MGVAFRAEGLPLPYEDTYDCGYATLLAYRLALASAASPVMGHVYRGMAFGEFSSEDTAEGEVLTFDMRGSGIPDGLIKAFSSSHEGIRAEDGCATLSMGLDALNAAMRAEYGPDLSSFLCAPDADGRLSADECAGILRDLQRFGSLDVGVRGHNYGTTELSVDEDGARRVRTHDYDMHEQFVGMFRHCAEGGADLVWD